MRILGLLFIMTLGTLGMAACGGDDTTTRDASAVDGAAADGGLGSHCTCPAGPPGLCSNPGCGGTLSCFDPSHNGSGFCTVHCTILSDGGNDCPSSALCGGSALDDYATGPYCQLHL